MSLATSSQAESLKWRQRKTAAVHPALWAGALFLLVVVSRFTEVLPILSRLPLGDIAALLSIALLVFGQKDRLAPFFSTPLAKTTLAFGVFTAATVAYSIWPGMSFNFMISAGVIVGILYYVITRTVTDIAHVRIYAAVLIVGVCAFVIRGTLGSAWTGRVAVESAYDQNDLALFLVVVFPLVLAETTLTASRMKRWMLIAIAIGSVLLLFLTQSRGGFLGLLAVCGYLLTFKGFVPGVRKLTVATRVKRIAVLAVVALPLLFVIPESARERLSTLTSISDDYNLVSDREGRVAIWSRGLEYLRSHPWGAGVAAYPKVDTLMGGQFRPAHNFIVQVFVEIGVMGSVVYVFMLGLGYRLMRKLSGLSAAAGTEEEIPGVVALHAYSHALCMALIGFIVTGFFLSVGYSALLFTLLALIGATARLGARLGKADEDAAGAGPRRNALVRGKKGALV